MQQFSAIALNGLTLGAVYAAFALSMSLIWRSTRIVNFAQAPMAMVTTFIAYGLIEAGLPYAVAFVAALVAGFLLGAFTERFVVRPVESKGHLAAVIYTLGLFIVLHAVAALVVGNDFRSFPAAFGLKGITVGGVSIPISGFGVFTIVAVGVAMLAIYILFKHTNVGLRMRASAFQPEVARLLGVRVNSMLTLGWALASVAGALAGLLIAGGNLIHPGFMDAFVVYGFVAAVLGGLDSALGSVGGGMLLGMVLSFVSGYVGAELVPMTSLVVLILVLFLKPNGLFSQVTARRV